MEQELIHTGVAAYALDVLDPEDERDFEAHLADCDRCREELSGFAPLGRSLAFAAPESKPSPELRGRILDAARAERANVVPLRPRRSFALVAVAAAAVCAAIGLGVWGVTRPGPQPTALSSLSLHGAAGAVLVAGDGRATLVVSGLKRAPAGRTYEIWVMGQNGTEPAGLFSAASRTATVRLTHRLSPGSVVAVTLERAGGSTKPSETPLFTSAPA